MLQCDRGLVPNLGAAALGSPSLTLRRDGLWNTVLGGPSLVAASPPQMIVSSPRWPSSGPSCVLQRRAGAEHVWPPPGILSPPSAWPVPVLSL